VAVASAVEIIGLKKLIKNKNEAEAKHIATVLCLLLCDSQVG